MPDADVRYDEDTETIWVAYDFQDAETLVPNEELRTWMAVVQEGETEDGRSVQEVNYIFADEASAAYNHQALSYGNIGTYVGTHGDCEPHEPDEGTPDFDTEKDFGIE